MSTYSSQVDENLVKNTKNVNKNNGVSTIIHKTSNLDNSL